MRGEEFAMPVPSNNLGHGLTKREYYASLALQGLMANRDMSGWSIQHTAQLSVEAALFDSTFSEIEVINNHVTQHLETSENQLGDNATTYRAPKKNVLDHISDAIEEVTEDTLG